MKKFIITPIVLLLILVTSCIGYVYTEDLSYKIDDDIIETLFDDSSDFPYSIKRYNLGLYYENLKLSDDSDPLYKIFNISGPPNPKDTYPDELPYERVLEDFNQNMSYFNETIWRMNQDRKEMYPNLIYYSENTDTKQVYKHFTDLTSVNKDDYLFYFTMNYDAVGNFSLGETNFSHEQASQILLNMEKAPYETQGATIKNMKFIYAYPKIVNTPRYDNLSTVIIEETYKNVNPLRDTIALAIIGSAFLLALIIPFKISKEFLGCKFIFKLPIEIISIATMFIFTTFNSNVAYIIKESLVTPNNSAAHLIKGAYFFVLALVFFYFFMTLKYMLNINIKEYFKKHCFIFIGLCFIYKKLKKSYNLLKTVDLKNKNTKSIVFLLIINLVIMSLLTCLWFFGIIGAVIYSILLFFYITKKYSKIMEDYNKLLNATNTMVHGNLSSFPSEEDMGIFNSLKNDLQNIEKGFKKAVDLEVQSQRMKTELITNVSHDLKTPLTAIISYIDLLKEESLTSENSKEYIETLEMKAQRLKFLIEDLFEVSKATSGNISLNIDEVDVVSLIKETLVEQEKAIKDSGIIFKTTFPKDKVIIPLDSQRTFRVFENLIVNISKYGLSNSRAYIDVKKILSDDSVEIVIKNISREEMNFSPDEIIERFVRGDKSRNTSGSGLGLAISKSFVELQGGTFDIQIDGDLFKVIIKFTS
ncbi:MAG: sensor histidine kinase [Clostridium sp.]